MYTYVHAYIYVYMYISTTVFSIWMESDKRLESSIQKPHTMPLLLM